MQKELAHSFKVILDAKISKRLVGIQKKLTKFIGERRNYDSSPHLAIATKFMSRSRTAGFVRAIKYEFRNEKSWELVFAGFSVAVKNKNYIFLNLNTKSRKKILALHKRAFRATKGIGSVKPSGLKKRPYRYEPHISIIKLQPQEAKQALKLTGKGLAGLKITVKTYEIARQQDYKNGFSRFPVIDKIELS